MKNDNFHDWNIALVYEIWFVENTFNNWKYFYNWEQKKKEMKA